MDLLIQELGNKTRLSGLRRSAAAFAIAHSRASWNKPLLLLCSNDDEARSLADDIQFFSMFLGHVKAAESVLIFPAWESSPYRKLLPSNSIRLERLRTLYFVKNCAETPPLVISYPKALIQSAVSPETLEQSFTLQRGNKFDLHDLGLRLEKLGYSRTETVEDPGTYSLRGGIADIFSPFERHPCRIEFFDIDVEKLRFYNSETQRSLSEDSDNITLHVIPVREMDCCGESLMAARERIRDWSDSKDLPRNSRERINDLLGQGISIPEMDYFLPLFQNSPTFGQQYFSEFLWIWHDEDPSREIIEKFIASETKSADHAIAEQQLVPPIGLVYKNLEQFYSFARSNQELFLDPLKLVNKTGDKQYSVRSEPGISLHLKEQAKGGKQKSLNVSALAEEIEKKTAAGMRVLIAANSQSQLDRIAFLLSQRKIRTIPISHEQELVLDGTARAHLTLGSVSEGFTLPESKLTVISEDEIFGKKIHSRRTVTKKSESGLKYLDEIQVDELVVHAEHGIGRYKGLMRIESAGISGDFVFLEYAENDKLYLPVYRLELLQKYVGSPSGKGALDRLGSQQFLRAKEKVKSAVKDIAAKLLRVHAERASKKGHTFTEPDELFREFEAEFPYDETTDQLKAIQDTLDDMCSPRPMDRLVCGDVGFGKTEVAIRAAFKAAQDGKQVAVLVPTTILAEQHYQSFSTRFREHPIRVASISRFRTREEQKKIVADLAEGKIDIIIGTHRLLSKDIVFRDLGLLVIDEEQRFGVEHKEKLKEIRATTDVLTLTATPIPRTLHLALMGLRDISLIQTAPADRLSIKTHLATFDPELIKTAVETELARGGQVFFIHNRVQTIEQICDLLKESMPKVRIAVAHGQMKESELERVMLGFYQKEFDILLATTIIENGLDVPNANTIIVNRADTFGLSQLYQIRGRVGRSQARAFAYFLIPESGAITAEARERLAILQQFIELGSGYSIAAHDLELRGGGDILGDAQSGHIAEVGYDMYLELLEEEVLRLKGEAVPVREEDVEINSPFPALLPENYIPDMRQRLGIYRRLSSLRTEEGLAEARAELLDRYGKLPFETTELLWLLQLKLLLRRVGFKAITIGKKAFTVTAGRDPQISTERLLAFVAAEKNRLSLSPEGKLTNRGEFLSLKSVYDGLRNLIDHIRSS